MNGYWLGLARDTTNLPPHTRRELNSLVPHLLQTCQTKTLEIKVKQDIRLETRRFGTLTTILKGSGQLNSLLLSPLHTQAHKASHLSIKEKPAGSMLGSIFSPNTPRILICLLVLGSPRLIHQYAMYYISKTLIDFEKKYTPLEKTCQIRDFIRKIF